MFIHGAQDGAQNIRLLARADILRDGYKLHARFFEFLGVM